MRFCLFISILLFIAGAFLAAPAKAEDSNKLFLEPSVQVSAFVTDKGTLNARLVGSDSRVEQDVHTGDYNLILFPGLALGYRIGRFLPAINAGWNYQLLDLNLRYGKSADGYLSSLEIGPSVGIRVWERGVYSLETLIGCSGRFLAAGNLHFDDLSEDRKFEGAGALGGFGASLGIGGDLADWKRVAPGWTLRFNYGRHDLTFEESGDTSEGQIERQRLQLNVYSAWIGFRLRITLN